MTLTSNLYRLDDVKSHESVSEAQAACYNRDHPRYPYKSHGQWLRATYGIIACIILLLFNGVFAFLVDPFDYQNFLVSYIAVSLFVLFAQWELYAEYLFPQIPVFIALIAGYKIHKHGFKISKWGPERSCNLNGCIQVTGEKRKGRLVFPDRGFTKENWLTFTNWIWVWIK